MKQNSGKAAGGYARAKKLSPRERKDIAKKAVKVRIENAKLPIAEYGSAENPLKIGGIEIPCYVLSNGKRVLVQKEMGLAIGFSEKSFSDRITKFIETRSMKPFVSEEVISALKNPIIFKTDKGGKAHGYEATILADICEAVLTARQQEALPATYEKVAIACEILMRGFARVGIIALIDEVTGYQRERKRRALAEILEQFIAKEIQPWVKTFPLDFYEHICRLRGLSIEEFKEKNYPSYFGKLTNNIVYSRLAPAVLEELKKKTPVSKRNNRTARYHQLLTREVGHPKLKEHFSAILTLMKISKNYEDFINKLNITHPQYKPIED